jgi:hypothetical protein
MKVVQNIRLLILSLIAGLLPCLFYHTTAIYSYGPAYGDYQYGWPLVYGYDQFDVRGWWGSYYINGLESISALMIDIGTGLVLGILIYWIARYAMILAGQMKIKTP